MAAGGVLTTIFTGTLLATGKTFTHGLGTLPDMVFVQPETNAIVSSPFVLTFDNTICVVGGGADDDEVRVLVQRLHSIIG
jgi:hypothetical protein